MVQHRWVEAPVQRQMLMVTSAMKRMKHWTITTARFDGNEKLAISVVRQTP